MGIFGKIFDKKVCDVCGGEIGLLGNRKLDDGNLCKECARKLSPWFEERRHSTVEAIKEQLAYREANKKKVQAFQITRDFAGDTYHVFLDDTKRQFAVATRFSVETNPDIVDLSQVTSCKLNIEESRVEEQYEDKDGNMQNYNPPRYQYFYEYSIKLGINSPWFDDMDFSLSSSSVEGHDRRKIQEMEELGNQIVAALTGNSYGQPMNGAYNQPTGGVYGQPVSGAYNQSTGGVYGQPVNGAYNQPTGGVYGQPVNGAYNQPTGGVYGQPVNGAYNQPANGYGQMAGGMQNGQAGTWTCSCGAVNTAKFCQECGQPRPVSAEGGYQRRQMIRCDKCGWVPEDPNNIPRFCPQCGDPFDGNDVM